jgi:ferredoxin--NADP+ reductase
VAVVGAGPAGFYATLDLMAHVETPTHVDMFDRLPTPYGLVRFGVAPDHQKIKTVTNLYARGVEAASDRFHLFGNVQLGADITLEELRARYHAVILTYGAQSDRHLGVAGEELPGVFAAREFVAWYNGHPDFEHASFVLSGKRAVVIGIGNVAIDVARILMRTPAELAVTDIAPYAASALSRGGGFDEVVILARRGPLQSKCTPVELRELTQMEAADLVVDPRDLALGPIDEELVAAGEVDRQSLKNLEVLKTAQPAPRPGRRCIRLAFFASPVGFEGAGSVEAIRIARNALVRTETGYVTVRPTGEEERLECDAVFRAIGYMVTAVPGVPYDEARQTIPHDRGQVLESPGGTPVPGLFVAGWAKRGPTGIIGTNKPDAAETVQTLLAAWRAGALPTPSAGDVVDLLAARGVRYVTYEDWKLLDQLETEAGSREGRPRVKFTDVEEMLLALAGATEGAA